MLSLRPKHDGGVQFLRDGHTSSAFCSESFWMIVFGVLGALCWDRHPFHAPGACSDLREIRWNMKSTTAEHTHKHTHTFPHRCVIVRLLGSFLGILWLQTDTGAEVSAAATPPSFLFSLCLVWVKWRRRLHLPPTPPSLPGGVRGVEVIDVLQWECRCRAWIIISPGTEQRSQEDTPKQE